MHRQDVLIVGEPFKVLKAYAMVLLQCQCEGQGLLVLVGAGVVTPCPSCGKSFAIVKSNGCIVGEVRPKVTT